MKRYITIGIAVVVAIVLLYLVISTEQPSRAKTDDFESQVQQFFARNSDDWILIPSNSIFLTYGLKSEFDTKGWGRIILEMDPTKDYTSIMSDGNTVVVYPTFTSSAYTEPGFYTFYRGECDVSCLTIPIRNNFAQPQANPNSLQVFRLLGYPIITDVDIDRNPSILSKYDKVILLHSEYVTKTEFDAITGHPYVIYLHPNALYAEIEADYEKNTITLIRGHNYPSHEITNGFDWEFDNTEYEYDLDCSDAKFYPIKNGLMLDCWPELIMDKSFDFLRVIKQL